MRHPRQPSGYQPGGGFTLVELLIALLIAGLVASLLYTLYHAVAVTARHQADRERARDPVAATEASLVENFQNLFLPADDPDDGLLLAPDETDPEHFHRVAFCTLREPTREGIDLRWAPVYRVRFETGPGRRARRLVRVEHPLTGPAADAGVTNVLLEGVSRFEVSLFDGEDWWSTWPPDPEYEGRPLLARVDIEGPGLEEPLQLNIYLPAGEVVAPPEAPATTAR